MDKAGCGRRHLAARERGAGGGWPTGAPTPNGGTSSNGDDPSGFGPDSKRSLHPPGLPVAVTATAAPIGRAGRRGSAAVAESRSELIEKEVAHVSLGKG